MINVVVPLVGQSRFFDDLKFKYPKPLMEIDGKTMVELFIRNLEQITEELNFIFVINEEDCKKFHLDSVLDILTNNNCEIFRITGKTKGAACSVLMAIGSINNNSPLIIANVDQIIDVDFDKVFSVFKDVDAGVITFNSVHPQWSYIRQDEAGRVIEFAEKNPLSKNAIAGFYYFAKGSEFVESAFEMIKKDGNVNGQYYVSPVLNEMILLNKNLQNYHIESKQYHSFYTPQKIEEYERNLNVN